MKCAVLFLSSLAVTFVSLNDTVFYDTLREKYQLPALSALSIVEGKTETYARGVRRLGTDAFVNEYDRYHLGPATTTMTATLLGTLIDKGLLSWDTPLETLFPELVATMTPEFRKVTVAMLAAHRSGLPTETRTTVVANPLWTEAHQNRTIDPTQERRLFTRIVLGFQTASAPGSKFEPSNGNYIILGTILEKLTRKSFETLMTDTLFRPLRMTSCGFGLTTSRVSPVEAWPHSFFNKIPRAIEPDPQNDFPMYFNPAGGVRCSLDDVAKFAKIHIEAFNQRPAPILSPRTFQKLHESYPGQTFTYGAWFRTFRRGSPGEAVLSYISRTPVSAMGFFLVPSRNAIFLNATNIGGPEAQKALDEVIAEMNKALR